jgi:aspartokinase
MISVSNAVLKLLQEDETAYEASIAGLLNYSAYAESILPQIEEATFKKVKKGTIVAALSRIARKRLQDVTPFKPVVRIHNLGVKAPLFALVYDKSADVQRRVATLNPFLVSPNDIFSVTECTTEIIVCCSEKPKEFIKNHIRIIPKKEMDNISAVTAQFAEKYAEMPNLLHTLFTALAHKRINLMYVVSGYTEISFLVEKKDMEETLKTLDVYTKPEKVEEVKK